jgi:hypothetical protein
MSESYDINEKVISHHFYFFDFCHCSAIMSFALVVRENKKLLFEEVGVSV